MSIPILARSVVRFAILGAMAIGLSQDCNAQSARSGQHPPHTLVKGTPFEGALLRAVCLDSLPVGDTVSATLHPPARLGFAEPEKWPKELTALLRRLPPRDGETLATGLVFSLVRISSAGRAYTGPFGEAFPDVESGSRRRTTTSGSFAVCYDAAKFFGTFSRAVVFD